MLEVSETASEEIKRFLQGREGLQSIRILLTEGDWKGPHLVMALDEPRSDDQVFMEKGVTFLIERKLFERVKPINIDYVHSDRGAGFAMKSDLMKGVKDVDVRCESICQSCDDLKK